jgi:hypothetical protein
VPTSAHAVLYPNFAHKCDGGESDERRRVFGEGAHQRIVFAKYLARHIRVCEKSVRGVGCGLR